ncbi:AI-2E family transporter [Aureivirga sp. CE67]|uniref:AI-2E family transporter n=1 Tax=Aureivirga sp. CE67 TaxID=1788983 RepID=UPI0018CBEFD4|nr:AI-2E family transporter [Aureivirga sp. CE67]
MSVNTKIIHPNIIKQIFTLLILFLIGRLIIVELLPYLSGFLGSLTLYILLKNPMKKLLAKKWKPTIAAAVLILFSIVCILIPISLIILLLKKKTVLFIKKFHHVLVVVKNQIGFVEDYFGYEVSDQFNTESISVWVSKHLKTFAGTSFHTVLSVILMYFLLYFMLISGKKFFDSILKYIPINEDNSKYVTEESQKIIRSNAIGIPLVALVQGVVAFIGFLVFDINNPLFWSVMVTLGSTIPFLALLIGILPVFLLNISAGNNFQAYGILFYGLFILGLSDSLARLLILKKMQDVHPVVTLLGILVGFPLFGYIGLIFGPLLINLFMMFVRIYKTEYEIRSKS